MVDAATSIARLLPSGKLQAADLFVLRTGGAEHGLGVGLDFEREVAQAAFFFVHRVVAQDARPVEIVACDGAGAVRLLHFRVEGF